MNAIKLYVSTARLVLENDQYDISVCKELNRAFPNLEQSLTCTVCGNILSEPYSPTETSCQHHVCKNCIGGTKKLKPSCSWCKDYTKYVKNTQLQCLLLCYKGLCQYIKCTTLLNLCSPFENEKYLQKIIEKGTELPSSEKDMKTKTELSKNTSGVREASAEVKDVKPRPAVDYQCHPNRDNCHSVLKDITLVDISRIKSEQMSAESRSLSPDKLTINPRHNRLSSTRGRAHSPRSSRNVADDLRRKHSQNELNDSSGCDDTDPKALYSVTFAGTRSKLILKRTGPSRKDVKREPTTRHQQEQLPITYSLRTPDYNIQNIATNDIRCRKLKSKPINNAERTSCRCGTATPKPGKLTCCGQRCACYMQNKACANCKCRGCRNPHMIDGVKILGRFTKENREQNMDTENSSGFQDLSASFLNQQVNQVLPDLPSNSILNIS